MDAASRRFGGAGGEVGTSPTAAPAADLMEFLLIDASVVINPGTNEPFGPARPTESNGAVTNELGTGSELSQNYPPQSDGPVPR